MKIIKIPRREICCTFSKEVNQNARIGGISKFTKDQPKVGTKKHQMEDNELTRYRDELGDKPKELQKFERV